MKKYDSEKWMKNLKTEFYDHTGMLQNTNYLKLISNENSLEKDLKANYFYGFSQLMPAFFCFCLQTYDNIANRKLENIPEKNILFNLISIPTFWRFRAGYIIFWKGYYISGAGLLRAVFENMLTIIAVENEFISEKDTFMYYSDLSIDEKLNYREIERRVQRRDAIIHNIFFGENSKLSDESKEIIKEQIVKNLHNSVHKSSNAIALYARDWLMGDSFPIFPRYHQDLSRLYSNIACLIGWIFLRTLPLLQIEKNEFSEEWKNKYQVLDTLFTDLIDSLPLEIGRAIEEFVSKYL